MREIGCRAVTAAIKEMFITANTVLPDDISAMIRRSAEKESCSRAREILGVLSDNADIAARTGIPICQDTGMAFVFVTLGQDVCVTGGSLREAIDEGVREAYNEGYLRKSVADPLTRVNTGDNTPAVIYYDVVPGDTFTLSVMPKGFGSENMSRIKMMNPTASQDDIVAFVKDTVVSAGGNPCPPTVIGVGIGGSFDYAAFLAKKALLGAEQSELSDKILAALNSSGVGPQGLGGDTTSLAVYTLTYPTHIASLPVAVNVSCHATRHVTKNL